MSIASVMVQIAGERFAGRTVPFTTTNMIMHHDLAATALLEAVPSVVDYVVPHRQPGLW